MANSLLFTRPHRSTIDSILQTLGEDSSHVTCSICGRDLSDVNEIGVIYPYNSALICCKKLDCILECTDKLLDDDFISR